MFTLLTLTVLLLVPCRINLPQFVSCSRDIFKEIRSPAQLQARWPESVLSNRDHLTILLPSGYRYFSITSFFSVPSGSAHRGLWGQTLHVTTFSPFCNHFKHEKGNTLVLFVNTLSFLISYTS